MLVMEMEFNLDFKESVKNIRHSGDLAIQTTSTVKIINCSFESNDENSNIDSSKF